MTDDAQDVGEVPHKGRQAFSLNECQALRHLKAAGWSMSELRMVFEVTNDTAIIDHLNGECRHPKVAEPMSARRPRPDELIAFRFKEGLNIKAASELVDVSIGAWQRWEKGENKPTEYHCRLLSDLIPYSELPEDVPDKFTQRGRPKGGSIGAQ